MKPVCSRGSNVPDRAGQGLAWIKAQRTQRQVWLRECQRNFAKKSQSASRLVLEIGCGHGHWLAAYAAQHPDSACLGIDLKTKRIQLATRKRDRAQLGNLQFCKTEALEFLEATPETLFWDAVCLLFPDPWPKARHHKNRLLQAPLLSLLADHTRPGARVYFRTDDQPYFLWAGEQVETHPEWEPDTGAPWIFEHETLFQNRARQVYSLVARRAQ